jgi:RNA ligase (TIGR02306 family)
MLNKIANIEIISEILPHPNADLLSIARIKGWQSVIKKNEYNVGDKVIFVYPDNELKRKSWNEFLFKNDKDEYVKIKGIKLRGQYSAGLILNINILKDSHRFIEGDNVAEFIGARKYEKILPAQLSGTIKGNFPTHIVSKTDEILIRNELDLLNELKGLPYYITTKADGSSCTCYFDGDNFGVCSRNLELKEDDSNSFWKVVKQYNLHNILKDNNIKYAIQGELVGPKVNGNRLQLKNFDYYIFNIKDLTSNKFLELNDMIAFCNKFNLQVVNIIETGSSFNKSLKELQDIANNLKYDCGSNAEGIVVRPHVNTYSNTLHGNLSFKVINENYKD